MAEDNFTLTTFFASWEAYQDRLAATLAPLTEMGPFSPRL
jgi:hypothetical protein